MGRMRLVEYSPQLKKDKVVMPKIDWNIRFSHDYTNNGGWGDYTVIGIQFDWNGWPHDKLKYHWLDVCILGLHVTLTVNTGDEDA